jgi:AcrR family transcriptional regulator
MVAALTSGLRERKKLRTRLTIIDVATRLFVEQGYQQTTLAQIAEEADVAPSTFFNYFPTKVDIVFSMLDAVIENAQRRLTERPDGEPAAHAIVAWLTEELPSVEQPYAEAIRRFPAIISSAPELVAEQRLRMALLEDVLAAAFARDLGESADGMRSHVLAAIALRGMLEAWNAWYEKHATDADFQLSTALEAKAKHVSHVLERGLVFIESLEGQPEASSLSAVH